MLRVLFIICHRDHSKERCYGKPVGVFSNKEVKGLSKSDIALLKAHVMDQIQTSEEIREILNRDRTLLRKLTRDPRINKILRREAGALKKRLERSSGPTRKRPR